MDLIKKLRKETGLSVGECQRALKRAKGNKEKAMRILEESNRDLAVKKSARKMKKGRIDAYVHSDGRIGVLVEMRCETDFVARNQDFKTLAHEIALQVAAMSPQFVKPEDIPEKVLKEKEELYKEESQDKSKSPEILKKIVQGRLAKYKKEVCLLEQASIKDPAKTVAQVIDYYTAKLGERIEISRFVRFEI